MSDNKFGCRRDFDTGSGKASYYSLEALEQRLVETWLLAVLHPDFVGTGTAEL